jgi:hypothetical protein
VTAGEDSAQVATTHVFVPLGFEARTGAFRPRARTFLREVADVADVADVASSSDLYHWYAMVWREHWEQRLGVKLAQGGKPRARRGRVGAGKRGGDLGAEGVAQVVSDRLPAMRQPLRVG